MKRNTLDALITLVGFAALLAGGPASAQRFSLDGGPGPGVPPLVSPSIVAPLVDNTDVLTAGPLGGRRSSSPSTGSGPALRAVPPRTS